MLWEAWPIGKETLLREACPSGKENVRVAGSLSQQKDIIYVVGNLSRQ